MSVSASAQRAGMERLLAPRSIAVVGGADAARAVEVCREVGFTGDLWAVNPRRAELAGVPCVPDVAALPAAPDAAFISVPAATTPEVVAELRRRGTGGVVCHASGFAETGADGLSRQRGLVDAAGEMPLLGPNCLGLINYLDGAALWCDQHGGEPVARGVGLISQSGNIGLNLTMQRRGLPVAYLATLGNQAVLGVPDLIRAMLNDERVTAIGMYLEAMPDPTALAGVAEEALRRRVPLVAVKVGATAQAADVVRTHTSSLAGSDAALGALLRRLGIARADDLDQLLDTLALLHVHGALPGRRIITASCSGGEAALVADLAPAAGVELPELPEACRAVLGAALGHRVVPANPLDYHTYAWGDAAALREIFDAVHATVAGPDAVCDLSMLVLDLPRTDRCSDASWHTALEAYIAGASGAGGGGSSGARAAIVSALAGGLPEDVTRDLIGRGVAPLQGIRTALGAVAAAAQIGAAQSAVERWRPPAHPVPPYDGAALWLHEAAGKHLLSKAGVPVPQRARARDAHSASRAASAIGYPVVVKVLSSQLVHKSDAGAVRLGLRNASAVLAAAAELRSLWPTEDLLIEAMVTDAVAELLVGVRQEPGAGLMLTIGAGGRLAEFARDTASLLLPAGRDEIAGALATLRIWPLVERADVEAVLDAVLAMSELALGLDDRLIELEVNPLLARPQGAAAVDAVFRLTELAESLERTGALEEVASP